MIDKRTNPYDINLEIGAPFHKEEIIKDFLDDVKKIRDKYIGQKQNSTVISYLARDLEYLLQEDKYYGITLKNNEFFTEDMWSLEKLLDEYRKEYPDRFHSKKKYTNMEVNNMLFDLNLCGVIGGYRSPAVCADIPSHNNKIFTGEYVYVDVPIINFR